MTRWFCPSSFITNCICTVTIQSFLVRAQTQNKENIKKPWLTGVFLRWEKRRQGEKKGCGISVPRMVLLLQIDCVIPSCNQFTSTTLMQSLFPCCLGYISVQTWNPRRFPPANNSLHRIRSSLRQERSSECHQSCYQQVSLRIFRDFAYVSSLLNWRQLEQEEMNKPKIILQVSDIIGRHSGILFSPALITAKPHNFNNNNVSCYVSSQLHCGNFELYRSGPPERNA